MLSHIGEKAKGFLMKPSATFQATRSESLTSAFQYYVILLIVFSILYAIVSVVVGVAFFNNYVDQIAATGLLGSIGANIMTVFAGFVATLSLFMAYLLFLILLFGVFLDGFFYHVFVILFGGTKGVVQTVKTVMYASTPFFILGWIPYISIIGVVWAWILLIIGIKENHEMVLGHAILVVVIPLVLVLILAVMAAAVVGTFLGALMSILPGGI
jgi:hypothetical protein